MSNPVRQHDDWRDYPGRTAGAKASAASLDGHTLPDDALVIEAGRRVATGESLEADRLRQEEGQAKRERRRQGVLELPSLALFFVLLGGPALYAAGYFLADWVGII